jgi:signal transduction histidine kinase
VTTAPTDPAVLPGRVPDRRRFHLVSTALAVGALLVGIFTVTVVWFRAGLRAEIRQTIIERDAAVLRPVALRQLAQREAALAGQPAGPADLLAAVMESAQQEGMLAVVVFDAQGRCLRVAPDSLLLAELPMDDYLRLLKSESISRYHPELALDRYFAGVGGAARERRTPVLEVLLPLHGRDPAKILGFAQYYIDARPLALELAAIDRRINRQTAATLATGAVLIAAVMGTAFLGLSRAQAVIAERNARLVRANFELTLAAKTSALGQITSHLIHGLQGPVAGLRAVVAGRGINGGPETDWQTAAGYAERLQAMIAETVAMLGDTTAHAAYELTGRELAEIIRQRNTGPAKQKGVSLRVGGGFDRSLDSHRGSLLCLITANLVQNAIEATEPGRNVTVDFGEKDNSLSVTVTDEGPGIPEAVRAHLFEPGRSGRPGGSGLGLTISRLLARQIGAELELVATGPSGTTFRLTLPT